MSVMAQGLPCLKAPEVLSFKHPTLPAFDSSPHCFCFQVRCGLRKESLLQSQVRLFLEQVQGWPPYSSGRNERLASVMTRVI